MPEPEKALALEPDVPCRSDVLVGASCPSLDMLFLLAPMPLCLTRRSDGLILAVNDAWVDFTGVQRQDAVGRTTMALRHWMSDQQRQDYLAALDAGQPLFTLETYARANRRVRLHTRTFRHEGADLLLVSLQEITREHDAEQRLIETNRQLQQQVELHEATERLARVGHWTVPEDDQQVVWSPGLRAIAGVDPGEVLTRDQARTVLHEDDRAAWLAAREAMDGRLIEFRVWTRDGQLRWVRSRMSHTTVRGNPQTDFGIVQDITAEKTALDAAAENAEFVRQIAARVPGLIYQARLRPDGRSEIPFVNDAVRDMLELEPQALRHDARLLFQRVHPDDRAVVEASLAVSARDLTPWRQRYRAVLPKGGVRWYSVEAVPQAEPDGSVLWHGFTTDVTEAHHANERLLAQHRMLEAIRQAQASYIDSRDRTQLFDALLQTVLDLTGSAYGFMGEVLRGADGQPYLRTHALSDIAWDEHSREQMARHRQEGMEFRNLDTLLGEVMTTGRPVMANRPASDSRSGGVPTGHPSLEAFLGVPVHVGDRIVAVVGLANRPGGYAESDIDFLRPLLSTLGQLVLALRARLERQRALDELKTTTDELRAKSQDLQAALDAMNQGLAMVDGQGRYRLYNRRMLEMLNLPDRFMAAQPTHEQVSRLQLERGDFGPDLAMIEPALRQHIGQPPASQPEQYLRRTLDGRVLEVRTRHRLDGGVVRTYSDVTSYVRAQEQLAEERQRLTWVLEGTRPGIWELDVASGELHINDRWAEMLGHTVDELRPLGFDTWHSRLHPDDVDLVIAILNRHMTGQSDFYECDLRMRHRQGHWVWINTRGRVHRRDVQGAPLYMSGTHIDITERVMAQEQVRALNATLEQRVQDRTAALERSMRDMETISYSIAHDLRAPLRAVNGFAALIAEQGEAIGPVNHEMFMRIARASRNMGQMITDMLELLRVVRVDLNTVPVHLGPLAQRVAESLAPGMQPSDLVCGDLPPVMGDATLLHQVLSNLLDNAIKYARPGARPRVELGYDSAKAAYYLRDSGVGFDMARAGKLFGLFQRMHLASDVPGTGVGLAIVARIIERHGGRIWAESAPGEGSTFWWTLPAA